MKSEMTMCALGVVAMVALVSTAAAPALRTNPDPPARTDAPGAPVAASVAAPSEEGAIQTITQSLSQVITPLNSAACAMGAFHEDNSYFRVFDLESHGIQFDFQVLSVEIGVESADSPVGVQPIEVRLYDTENLLSLPPPIGVDVENVVNQSLTHVSFDVGGVIRSRFLVVEIFTPSGVADGNSFFIGSNALGQTGPSFALAPACGITTPTDFADLGFPDMHIVMNVTGHELTPSGAFAVDTTPDILGFMPTLALPGEPTPRPYRIVHPDDMAHAVVRVKNIAPTTAVGVMATLTPPPGSGIAVLNNPVSLGDVASGVETNATFHIETTGAPVALHELELSFTSSLGAEVDPLWIPIWDEELLSFDPVTGHVDAAVVTPLSSDTISFVAPELFDVDGNPASFDLQSLNQDRVFSEPFFGVHWGEAGVEDPVVVVPVAPTEQTGNFNLHGVVKTKSGAPIAGVTLKLVGTINPAVSTTSDANGQYWFMNVPKGSYRFHVDPPAILRRFYAPTWKNPFQFGSSTYTNSVTYPDIPPSAGTASTTSNTGGPTPPPTSSGGGKTKKSVIGGGAVGVGTAAIDLAAGLKTWGLTLLSLGGAALIGGGTAVAADPVETDIFYAAEEMTPPLSPMELTLTESVTMGFTIALPPPGSSNIMVSSTWDFTRTTDAAVYTASGAETIEAPILLQLVDPSAVLSADGASVVVSTGALAPNGVALSGGEALVTTYLGRFDDLTGLGMTVLHDDGQAPDGAASDGVYSALMPIPVAEQSGPPLDVFFWAQRTGFADHLIPPLFAFGRVDVTAPAVADINGDGVVNGADLAILLVNFGPCPPALPCPADLNGDGVVNGADLAILLVNFGP